MTASEATHCFDETILNTLVQQSLGLTSESCPAMISTPSSDLQGNRNPIEKMERHSAQTGPSSS